MKDGRSTSEPEPKTTSKWLLPPAGVAQIIRALSLVVNVPVSADVIWVNYGEHAHFGQTWGYERLDAGVLPSRSLQNFDITADTCQTVSSLLPKLKTPDNEVTTALKYWLKSKAHDVELIDALVYLRTALESLFLDGNDHGELRFRLSTYGAWYTGHDAQDRQRKNKNLKEFYDVASRAVHTGKEGNKAVNLLSAAQDICRQAILKRLQSKGKPKWSELVFGR